MANTTLRVPEITSVAPAIVLPVVDDNRFFDRLRSLEKDTRLSDHTARMPERDTPPTYLLSRHVWTLSGFGVVSGPVERHVFATLAVLVVHLITLFHLNLVHLDRTAHLGGHQNLRGHHLTWKQKQEDEGCELRNT